MKQPKKELDVIYNHITDGIILRPKARWYEEGEKSTKYFLSMEKSNKARTHIRKLLRFEGSTEKLIDPKIIQSEIKSFTQNCMRGVLRKLNRNA